LRSASEHHTREREDHEDDREALGETLDQRRKVEEEVEHGGASVQAVAAAAGWAGL